MVEHFASWIHHSNKLVITILFYFLSKIFIFIENIVPSNKILTTQIKSVWIRIVEIFKLARKDFSHFKLRNLSRKKKLDCIRIETVWFGFKHENEIRTASKTKLTNRTTETLTLNLVHLHRHGCYQLKFDILNYYLYWIYCTHLFILNCFLSGSNVHRSFGRFTMERIRCDPFLRVRRILNWKVKYM